MRSQFIEATNGFNWGKFVLIRFDPEDHAYLSQIDEGRPLLRSIGWWTTDDVVMVVDLQTGEGAFFRLGGNARSDLNKHRVWVCPMFEPMLVELYRFHNAGEEIPALIHLPDAPSAMQGYRRTGDR